MEGGGVTVLLFSKRAIWTSNGSKVRVEGVLTGSSARLEWHPNNPTAAQPITINSSSITSQQRAKGKPLLRLVTTAQPHVFELASEAERDAVVELLAPVVLQSAAAQTAVVPAPLTGAPPASAGVTGPDAALRQKLLNTKQELRDLYTQLVDGGVLRPTEFWAGQAALVRAEAGRAAAGQRMGLSSAMLSDVQTSADGRTETHRVRLTPAVIHQTFAEKPAIRRAFVAQVPHNMTELAFWTKYMRLQYKEQGRRSRLASGAKEEDEDPAAEEDADFFRRYERSEDLLAAPPAHMRRVDPTVNLAADQYDCLAEGFGIGHDPRKEPVSKAGNEKNSLVREINRHAQVVMEGLPQDLPEDAVAAAAALEAARKTALADQRLPGSTSEAGTASAAQVELWQRRGESGLDDLQRDVTEKPTELIIRHPSEYFGAGSAREEVQPAGGGISAREAAQSLQAALSDVDPDCLSQLAMSSGLAMQVTLELTHDASATEDSLQARLGPDSNPESLLPRLQEVLRQTALMLNELLRHFWASFPAKSRARLEKLERVHQGLVQQYDKIQGMQQAAGSGTERVQVQQLMKPLIDALDAAFAKYEAEKAARTPALAAAAAPSISQLPQVSE